MKEYSKVGETLIMNLYPLPFNSDILNHTVDYFYTIYTMKQLYEGKYIKIIYLEQNNHVFTFFIESL